MAVFSAKPGRRLAPDHDPEAIRNQAQHGLAELTVQPAILKRLLLVTVVILGGADVVLQMVDAIIGPDVPGWVQLVKMFDLDREASLTTWYSIILLAASSVLLGLIAWTARRAADSMWRYWLALALIFAAFSIDEQVIGHESVGDILGDAMNTGGIFYYAWVIPAIVAVIAAGLAFVPFLRSLAPAMRNKMLIAASLYLSGALGMEMVSGIVADRRGLDNLLYATLTSIEEILEILGISYFLLVLVAEIGRRVPGVAIAIHRRPEPDEYSSASS